MNKDMEKKLFELNAFLNKNFEFNAISGCRTFNGQDTMLKAKAMMTDLTAQYGDLSGKLPQWVTKDMYKALMNFRV